MARPYSDKLIKAVHLVADGLPAFAAAQASDLSPNRLYLALAKHRCNDSPDQSAQDRARAFLASLEESEPSNA